MAQEGPPIAALLFALWRGRDVIAVEHVPHTGAAEHVSLLGTVILVTDIAFYASIMSGNPFLVNMGTLLLVNVLIVG